MDVVTWKNRVYSEKGESFKRPVVYVAYQRFFKAYPIRASKDMWPYTNSGILSCSKFLPLTLSSSVENRVESSNIGLSDGPWGNRPPLSIRSHIPRELIEKVI